MRKGNRSALYWAPRVIGIGSAVFLALFAFDVFDEGGAFGVLITAFFIHLIPSLLILISITIAWRWERTGGVLLILLGMLYIVMFWNPGRWFAYLIIAGPLFIAGFLFLVNEWISRSEADARVEE